MCYSYLLLFGHLLGGEMKKLMMVHFVLLFCFLVFGVCNLFFQFGIQHKLWLVFSLVWSIFSGVWMIAYGNVRKLLLSKKRRNRFSAKSFQNRLNVASCVIDENQVL